MTWIDKNRYILPMRVGETSQQKRHPMRSAFSNGGAAIFDGGWVLRQRLADSLFIRQKTGNFAHFGIVLRILEIFPNKMPRRSSSEKNIQIP